MFVSVHKSPEPAVRSRNGVWKLRGKGVAFVSTNDAVCAELAAAIALKGQRRCPSPWSWSSVIFYPVQAL